MGAWEKRKVYVVTVYFTEESNFDEVSEEYFADKYDEIEDIKSQIRSDYEDWEIDSIIVSDEPEIREFWKKGEEIS